MHIVLGALSAFAGLIWAVVALQRSGFNPDSINPFLWYRRAQWRRKYAVRPIYNLAEPMDVAALLVLGIAKCEGEISREQKQAIHDLFETEFKLDRNAAADLLLASSHLLRDEIYLVDHLDKILFRSGDSFSAGQVSSLLGMMHRIGTLESALNEEQHRLIDATQHYFRKQAGNHGRWS
jgi:uncharacterized tellurite resistance protein B-like protein